MSDANDPTTTFLNALAATAAEAVSGGLHLRLVLKGGEVEEGVAQSVRGSASNRPAFGSAPSPEDRDLYVDRVETSVRIGDTEVLLQEVASFTVTLR